MTSYSRNSLIIIRGPSCSGKTTIAKKLFDAASSKTALIAQDHYRFIFNPAGGGSKFNAEAIHKMIEHNTLVALQMGYNVILEGILSTRSYAPILNRIISSHSGNCYIFYFNVSLEETIKRHASKGSDLPYGEMQLREWYPSSCKLGYEQEILIPESYTVDETIRFVLDVTRNGCPTDKTKV